MANVATFTKRIGGSRNTFVVWIPRDVTLLLSLKRRDIIEVRLRKLRGEVAS